MMAQVPARTSHPGPHLACTVLYCTVLYTLPALYCMTQEGGWGEFLIQLCYDMAWDKDYYYLYQSAHEVSIMSKLAQPVMLSC